MCGIVAFLGSCNCTPILVRGLERLEYRGYDSAGICILTDEGKFQIVKKVGKVKNLKSVCDSTVGSVGIAHTRWATHGPPSDENSHPHRSDYLAIVHNGIIENYSALKSGLVSEGYVFVSQTDTEVLAHLIHSIKKKEGCNLETAVRMALQCVRGTFGVVIVSEENPRQLIAARKGSPLLLGIGDNEFIIASDASAVIERTRNVVYFNDNEMVVCTADPYEWNVTDLNNCPQSKTVEQIELQLEQIEKGGYKHFMLKEIFDQPNSLSNCLRGRLDIPGKRIVLGGLKDAKDRLMKAKRIIIAACGTSWHAGLVGEYLIETLARVNVSVEYASEFRYRHPILDKDDDVVMVISQSGETADTLAAVREGKAAGCLTLGVVNTVGSTIARETDYGVYLHAGPEIGVASTKAFTAQVTVLTMIALQLAQWNSRITDDEMVSHLQGLADIPAKIKETLSVNDQIMEMSKVYRYAHNFLFLGRGFNFPVALEGALKLKEISYIHAEGYPAAEMKHGPIALIDRFMPTVFIALKSDPMYEKVKSNIEEVNARGGSLIIVTGYDNKDFDKNGPVKAEFIIRIPSVHEYLQPLITVVPLQLMSYYIADLRGCSIDQPRNLAKSVTVE